MPKESLLSPEQMAYAKEIIAAELTAFSYQEMMELAQGAPEFTLRNAQPPTEADIIISIKQLGEESLGFEEFELSLQLGVQVVEAILDHIENFEEQPVELLASYIEENKVSLATLKIEDESQSKVIAAKITAGWKTGVLTHWLIHLRVIRDNFSTVENKLAEMGLGEFEVVSLVENEKLLLLFK